MRPWLSSHVDGKRKERGETVSALLLLVSATTLGGWLAHAADKARLPDTFEVPAIDAYLAAQTEEPDRVGLSVALVKDGQVAMAKGYGKASITDDRPVTSDTLFAIGSVSKQFTCACILQLAEAGKLSVRDPVAKYFPGLTRAQDITLLT